MNSGMEYNFGDIILADVQYTDTFEIKQRPALVLFEEKGNIVVAGITSNLKMKGISISKNEGLPKDSIIKMNYIFTISEKMAKRFLLHISNSKKELVRKNFIEKLN
jgi:mRNA interferase MazF